MRPRNISHNIANKIIERIAFTIVPCVKLSLRMSVNLESSNDSTLLFTSFSRCVSCSSRPKLFTNSTLRIVSVVDPARFADSITMFFWIIFIFLPKKNSAAPKIGMTIKYKSPMIQLTKNA